MLTNEQIQEVLKVHKEHIDIQWKAIIQLIDNFEEVKKQNKEFCEAIKEIEKEIYALQNPNWACSWEWIEKMFWL
jgi:hypothetical protein